FRVFYDANNFPFLRRSRVRSANTEALSDSRLAGEVSFRQSFIHHRDFDGGLRVFSAEGASCQKGDAHCGEITWPNDIVRNDSVAALKRFGRVDKGRPAPWLKVKKEKLAARIPGKTLTRRSISS